MHRSQRSNQAINHPRNQIAYTLFLVHLPYSINKSLRIHVFYCPWYQHCIIWVTDMRWNTSSGVRKSLFGKLRIKYECNSDVIFFWNITKIKKGINYHIEEWHTSAPYVIFRNVSYYQTVCLVLDTSHRNHHCITVCGEWIFDSNFEVKFAPTKYCLNYICCGNDTDEIIFFGVLHEIRAVPLEVVQIRVNIK